jgi:hypothetical protein
VLRNPSRGVVARSLGEVGRHLLVDACVDAARIGRLSTWVSSLIKLPKLAVGTTPNARPYCSLESLVDGQNWFLNQFNWIPRRSIIVCFISRGKAGINLPPFEISCYEQRLRENTAG